MIIDFSGASITVVAGDVKRGFATGPASGVLIRHGMGKLYVVRLMALPGEPVLVGGSELETMFKFTESGQTTGADAATLLRPLVDASGKIDRTSAMQGAITYLRAGGFVPAAVVSEDNPEDGVLFALTLLEDPGKISELKAETARSKEEPSEAAEPAPGATVPFYDTSTPAVPDLAASTTV